MFLLDGHNLRLEHIEKLCLGTGARIGLHPRAVAAVKRARRVVEDLIDGDRAIYGVNTGFGRLANVRIERKHLEELQVNLIRSHALAVGSPLPRAEAMATLLLRINTFARGNSGVSLGLVRWLVRLFNAGICPVIYEQGSVGASGDLAPLAHLGLVVIGEGEILAKNGRKPVRARAALLRAGLKPHRLLAKEGLSIINGTPVMTGIAAVNLVRAGRLCRVADIAGAMSLEATRGTLTAFDDRIQLARPHPGQRLVAANIRRLLRGSRILLSHKACDKIQDNYSIRCMPQVHGAIRDVVRWVGEVVTREMNSTTDNPLVFAQDGEILSGGNFHGHPVALAADTLALAVSGLGSIAERRIESLVNPDLSGLPPFLTRHSGLNSGLMMAQVAAASLASENKTLCHPASADSIPTSAGREDYVSMGTTAARKCRKIIENVEYILALELICAAQALDLSRNFRAGQGVERAHALVHRHVPTLRRDRSLHGEIELVASLIREGAFEGI